VEKNLDCAWFHAPETAMAGHEPGHFVTPWNAGGAYEHPLVEPQVSHFRQVPLRTIVKLPHSEQLSPS